MSQANLNYLSTILNISLDELKKIDIPERSVIVTSIRDVSSSTPGADPLTTRQWNEFQYEIQSVEYICQDCFSSFSSAEQHRQHVLSSHVDIKIIKTEECEFETGNCNPTICTKEQTCKLATGNSHNINHVHHHRHQSDDRESFSCSIERKLECFFCRKIFANKKNLMLHLKTHKRGDKYYCDVCLYSTKFLYNFENHMNQHINAGLLICYECGDSFVYKTSVKKHLESLHKPEFQNYNCYRRSKSPERFTEECPLCRKKFLTKYSLKLHNKIHRKENYFYCNVCLYKSESYQSLVSHSDKHMNDKLYICYHCGRSYEYKASLEIHLYYQHGLQPQSIDDHQSLKSPVDKKPRDLLGQKHFSNAESLKLVDAKHKKITYQCDVCLYTTFCSIQLNRHISRHMDNKIHICFHCGAFYKKKASLEKHLNLYRDPKLKSINHHRNPNNRTNPKLTCLYCQKKFSDVKSLSRHKGTHREGNNYHCNICLYTTASRYNFDVHMKKHFNDILYTCYHCGRSSKKKLSLENHLKLRHDSEFRFFNHHESTSSMNKKFACLLCQKKFPDVKSLSRHKGTHKKGNNYYCNVCLYATASQLNFYRHIERHFNDQLYICYHCGKSCRQKIFLENHLKFRHDPDVRRVNHQNSKRFINKKFICLCCNRKFPDQKNLNLHKVTHKNGDNYHCNVCLYKITKLQNFDSHMKKHFNDKLSTCYHCGRSFKKKISLEYHLKFRHDLNVRRHNSKSFINKKLMCLYCNEKFPDQKNLNRHKVTHKKGDHYHCNVCLYKITRLHNFDNHMKKHFNDELYTCYHCGRSFRRKKLLKDHLNLYRDPNSQMINHHRVISFRNKYLVCLFCQKQFPDIKSLEQHKETHKGNNYQCNVCLYKTKDTRDFESHTNKHVTGLHTCYHCGKSFRIKASLEKHFNFYHNPNFRAINHPN